MLASSVSITILTTPRPPSRLPLLGSPLFRPLVNNLNSGNSLPEVDPPNHPLHLQYPASNVCRMPQRRLRTQTQMSGVKGIRHWQEPQRILGRDQWQSYCKISSLRKNHCTFFTILVGLMLLLNDVWSFWLCSGFN